MEFLDSHALAADLPLKTGKFARYLNECKQPKKGETSEETREAMEHGSAEQGPQQQPKRKKAKTTDCDHGDSGPSIPRIQFATISAQDFFARFVGPRQPCVILGHPNLPSATILRHEMENLKDCVVHLERRKHAGERFGQERSDERQVESSLAQFVRNCYSKDSAEAQLLYLSTQPDPRSNNIADVDAPPPPFFGPPCDRLACIPREPLPLAGNLRLDSCHLWMGVTPSPASTTHSGLHHDFHDNFYLLLSGQKMFHLYPPSDAPYLGVVGEIDCLHANGLISYKDNPTEQDGKPIEGVEISDSREEEEEEGVIIGKGFDYESDEDEDDGIDAPPVDDFSDDDGDAGTERSAPSRPQMGNNFCWIDPTVPREKIVDTFPSYGQARMSLVTLQAGEVLYLPASWFHCVVSNGSSPSCPVHMAVNHWYTPPDNLSNSDHPYINEAYWNKKS